MPTLLMFRFRYCFTIRHVFRYYAITHYAISPLFHDYAMLLMLLLLPLLPPRLMMAAAASFRQLVAAMLMLR